MAISSNIIYVEPNDTTSLAKTQLSYNEFGQAEEIATQSMYEMTPNLEDYCIAFQLAVEVPASTNKGAVTTDNKVMMLSWKNEGDSTAVSLLQGTRRPGTDVNYLTTAALETTLTDVKKASPTEMFGVKSIDIQYNAWQTPEITIKFTDIRGASVFTPEEISHPGGFKVDDKNLPGSFFRCFFVTPNPLFGLVVKGFYGEAVSYELMYSNFTYKLDSSTGNFEAEAKFVGYSWSVLADVTLNAVACAPYCSYGGEEYWDNKVNEGAFVSKEGTPLPKLPQIINAFKNLKKDSAKMPQLDSTAQDNQKLENNQTALTNTRSQVREIVGKMTNWVTKNNYGVSISNNNQDGFICIIPGVSKVIDSTFITLYEELKAQKIAMEEANIVMFKSTFEEWKDSSEEFKDNDSKKYYSVGCGGSNENGEITYLLTSMNVPSFPDKDDEVWGKFKTVVEDGKVLVKNNTAFNIMIVNLTEWNEEISKKITENEESLAKNDSEMKTKMQMEIANAIGMAPTLHNIIKVMVAHLETLINCVIKCEDNISKERTFKSAELDQTSMTDECSVKAKTDDNKEDDGDTHLPPFPAVKARKERDGRSVVEDEWLGDLSDSDELEEVKLIEALLMAVNKLYDETNLKPDNVINSEYGSFELNCAVPIVPSDLFLTKKIWGSATINKENCAELIAALGYRASYLMYAMKDCYENSDEAGKLDAFNFNAEFPNSVSSQWRNLIQFDDFPEIAMEILTRSNNFDKAKPYASNLPWQINGYTGALFDENCNPNFPDMVSSKTKEKLYYYPIQAISFQNKGFGGQEGKAINTFDTFALRNRYTTNDREGKTLFKFLGDPRNASEIADAFDKQAANDGIAEVKNVGNFKDNFEPLKKYGENSSYAKFYGSDCVLWTAHNHRYFTKTLAASNANISINNLKPSYTTKSYTLPNSKSAVLNLGNKTAFNTNGKISKFNHNLTTIIVDDGSGNAKELKRDNKDNIDAFFKQETIDIADWTIPMFFALDTDGFATDGYSVFTQESYINAQSKYEKAIMLLLSLTHGDGTCKLEKCWDILTKTSDNGKNMFKVAPYFVFLLLGGYFYWMIRKDNGTWFRQDEENRTKNYHKSFVTQAFSPKSEIPRRSYVFGEYEDKFKNWRPELKNFLIDEFKNWVEGGENSKILNSNNNYISFQTIHAELGQVFCKKIMFKGEEMTLPTYIDRVLKAKKGYTLPKGKTFEQWLSKYVDDNFFKNYLTVYEGTADDVLRLYTREDSDVIKKITGLITTNVLFVPYNEWLGLDGKQEKDRYPSNSEMKKIKDRVKNYFKGFQEQYKKLIGLDTSESSTSTPTVLNAEDLDKHVKITLYNYIKILYDKWLSAKLFSQNVNEHWGVELFFKNHFHFMDQFYVDCSDIFFDMEGMANDFLSSFTNETFTLLSFIQNALAKTKCVMYPVQNFLNFGADTDSDEVKKENYVRKMRNLFKPMSYIEAFKDAPAPHQIYPDFVILYSSEPSSKPSDSECDDSMMLNYDEEFLPLPIRGEASKGRLGRIPAFGVTYGKQYQSYFQSIDVSTDTPIPTEQSLKTQYMIAGMSNATENGQQIQCLGQDLYTVYSKQSYSCTVQMMGNMWIQPTMYFVLTNVPTFRGSYIIQKVTHSITQGRMTTTFMGTRMANTNQPFVYNWFIGKNGYNGSSSSEDDAATRATIDNDCPYKFFTPGQGGSGTGAWTDAMLNSTIEQFVANPEWESDPTETKAQTYYSKWKDIKVIDFFAFTANREYKVMADDPIETKLIIATLFNNYTNGNGSKPRSLKWFFMPSQICLDEESGTPNGSYYKEWNNNNEVKTKSKSFVRDIFTNSPAILIGQVTSDNKVGQYKKMKGENFTPSVEMKNLYDKSITLSYDNLSKITHWAWPSVIQDSFNPDQLDYTNAFKNNTHVHIGVKSRVPKWELVKKEEKEQKTLTDELEEVVDAIQQTCSFSSAINISKIYRKIVTENDDYTMMAISIHEGFDKPTKENAVLFDIAINTYSDYLDRVYWMAKDINSTQDYPRSIYITKYKKKVIKRRELVYLSEGNVGTVITPKDNITNCTNCQGIFNELFYKALVKKYGVDLSKEFFAEVTNFLDYQDEKEQDKVKGLLTMFRPTPCDGGVGSGGTVLLDKCC